MINSRNITFYIEFSHLDDGILRRKDYYTLRVSQIFKKRKREKRQKLLIKIFARFHTCQT